MLAQYIQHFLADQFLLGCAITMLALFLVDFLGVVAKLFGISSFRHIDFKTTIVSIGLFATFFGVLAGLYDFDPKNIAGSVPQLLEGLRFAFAASVLGMFLSLSLSIIHKLIGGDDDDEEILHSIDKKMGALVTTIKSPEELVRQFADMKTFLKTNLGQINKSLDQALVQLARGATQEVIQALDKIITEFNDNLKAQFGENFKELNVACHKLVEWQTKYKSHIDSAEGRLAQIINALEASCKGIDELTAKYEKTTKICQEVGSLISTYDVQVRTLATHLESCKTLGERANDFLGNTERAITLSSQNLNSFSQVIETAVSKQSESLAQLTQELDQQVPKALGELDRVLTNLTNQFAADYKSLFQFITDQR